MLQRTVRNREAGGVVRTRVNELLLGNFPALIGLNLGLELADLVRVSGGFCALVGVRFSILFPTALPQLRICSA